MTTDRRNPGYPLSKLIRTSKLAREVKTKHHPDATHCAPASESRPPPGTWCYQVHMEKGPTLSCANPCSYC